MMIEVERSDRLVRSITDKRAPREGTDDEQFRGKVAIVTGGASGIGKALCETLCQYGAHVIVADIDVAHA